MSLLSTIHIPISHHRALPLIGPLIFGFLSIIPNNNVIRSRGVGQKTRFNKKYQCKPKIWLLWSIWAYFSFVIQMPSSPIDCTSIARPFHFPLIVIFITQVFGIFTYTPLYFPPIQSFYFRCAGDANFLLRICCRVNLFLIMLKTKN